MAESWAPCGGRACGRLTGRRVTGPHPRSAQGSTGRREGRPQTLLEKSTRRTAARRGSDLPRGFLSATTDTEKHGARPPESWGGNDFNRVSFSSHHVHRVGRLTPLWRRPPPTPLTPVRRERAHKEERDPVNKARVPSVQGQSPASGGGGPAEPVARIDRNRLRSTVNVF